MTRLILLGGLLGLKLVAVGEPKGINKTDLGEEVSERIFQMWYEHKDSVDFCRLIEGYIDKTADYDDIYLETSVSKEEENDFLPREKETMSVFLNNKIRLAEARKNVGKYYIFLDSRTRCAFVKNDKNDESRLRCRTCYTKKEFEDRVEKMKKKEKK